MLEEKNDSQLVLLATSSLANFLIFNDIYEASLYDTKIYIISRERQGTAPSELNK